MMKKVILAAIIVLIWASVAIGHPRVEVYQYPNLIVLPSLPPHKIYVPAPPVYVPAPLPYVGERVVPAPLPYVGKWVIIDRQRKDGHRGWIFRW